MFLSIDLFVYKNFKTELHKLEGCDKLLYLKSQMRSSQVYARTKPFRLQPTDESISGKIVINKTHRFN
jgi:hypothetical protein